MEVTSSGGEELRELILFVVDAYKPFLSPATWMWGRSSMAGRHNGDDENKNNQ